ncbi:hypothetical protein RRG08_027619 [Elysia crispata]|uniref:PiggyBac transposable element-derived protein domain-containing protein n=1 Tax=Elysia crispata TaxID=231223 RepID=A0AAE1AFJ5_9GAST|nr:hypothetical protein RRG08_027619 [Elysia crispata]
MATYVDEMRKLFTTNCRTRDIQAHTAKVHSVAWSCDGRRLASGSFDKTVCIYALDKERLDVEPDDDGAEVAAAATQPAHAAVPADAAPALNGEDGDWSPEATDIIIQDFTEHTGPRHNLGPHACPLDFFWLMFPIALLTILVEETNRYAQQCIMRIPNSSWYDTDINEMRAFLAIQIIFGIKQQPQLWMYWSEDRRFNDAWVSGIMTIQRFKNLSRYFHCRDTSATPPRGRENYDPLFKVRNVIQTTQRTFNECFQVCRDLSVDECMVAFKGRLSF